MGHDADAGDRVHFAIARLFDSHRKLFEYKSHPDIQYVLHVDPDSPSALLHYRQSEAWRERVFDSLEDVVEFPEIGASLALSDVYYGLEFGLGLAESENSRE